MLLLQTPFLNRILPFYRSSTLVKVSLANPKTTWATIASPQSCPHRGKSWTTRPPPPAPSSSRATSSSRSPTTCQPHATAVTNLCGPLSDPPWLLSANGAGPNFTKSTWLPHPVTSVTAFRLANSATTPPSPKKCCWWPPRPRSNKCGWPGWWRKSNSRGTRPPTWTPPITAGQGAPWGPTNPWGRLRKEVRGDLPASPHPPQGLNLPPFLAKLKNLNNTHSARSFY